ncbi:hypothetical protein ACFSC3_03145 [Sphingomonas floccifaciens]|uniref:Uncharacterized protein n=1 Tax=Sphingomonas floccifaciens TaxID=1844115 RepID=A0ABW4N9C3_9SPHN
MVRKFVMSAVALSMVATPVMAQTASNPAAKLSLAKAVPANARVSATAGKNKALAGTGLIIAIVAGAAVVAGIIAIASDSDSN